MDSQSLQPVTDIVETLEDAVVENNEPQTPGSTTIGEILEDYSRASFAAALLAVGLLLFSPLSGIPLFSSICGLMISLIALQGVLGRKHIWLPNYLKNFQLQGQTVEQALARIHKVAAWIDRRTRPRFCWLVTDTAARAYFGLLCCVGLFVPLLEFVPFSSTIIGLGTAMIATGILVRDGLFALVGICLIPVAFSLPLGAVALATTL